MFRAIEALLSGILASGQVKQCPKSLQSDLMKIHEVTLARSAGAISPDYVIDAVHSRVQLLP